MIKGLYKALDLGGGVGHQAIAENEAVGDKIPEIDLTIDLIKSMIRLEIISQKTIGIVETITIHIGIDHTETDLLIAMITDINILKKNLTVVYSQVRKKFEVSKWLEI